MHTSFSGTLNDRVDTFCTLNQEVQVAYWQEGGLPSRRPVFGSRPAYFSDYNPMILISHYYS